MTFTEHTLGLYVSPYSKHRLHCIALRLKQKVNKALIWATCSINYHMCCYLKVKENFRWQMYSN